MFAMQIAKYYFLSETTAGTRLVTDLQNYISEDVDVLVSSNIPGYVPDLPAIRNHHIKDEDGKVEDKLYFPISVLFPLLFLLLWLVLIDVDFVLTHVGHI